MAEYKEISSELKMLLSKAEKMGWNWDAYIEPDNRRTYVEIGQASPAGEDFSMIIDFKEKDQAKSFKENLQMYYEDFDVDEHIEMWIEARHNGISGVPSTRELVKDAEAIENMILELCEALSQVRLPLLIGSYSPENGRQDTGERRELRQELQRRCGLSELQAINILNGFHVKDYIAIKEREYAENELRKAERDQDT